MSTGNELYDQDFVLWAEEQAAALRRLKGSNLPLDWENLAEEIESLGKSERKELRWQIRRILRHLCKLAASPAMEQRAGWRATVHDARSEIEDVLRDSPSLRREIDALVAEQTTVAVEFAAGDLEQHGEPTDALREQLKKGVFTAEQVLEHWFPEPA
jgi:hypothetical protein